MAPTQNLKCLKISPTSGYDTRYGYTVRLSFQVSFQPLCNKPTIRSDRVCWWILQVRAILSINEAPSYICLLPSSQPHQARAWSRSLDDGKMSDLTHSFLTAKQPFPGFLNNYLCTAMLVTSGQQ